MHLRYHRGPEKTTGILTELGMRHWIDETDFILSSSDYLLPSASRWGWQRRRLGVSVARNHWWYCFSEGRCIVPALSRSKPRWQVVAVILLMRYLFGHWSLGVLGSNACCIYEVTRFPMMLPQFKGYLCCSVRCKASLLHGTAQSYKACKLFIGKLFSFGYMLLPVSHDILSILNLSGWWVESILE